MTTIANLLFFLSKNTHSPKNQNIPVMPSLISYEFEVNVTSGPLTNNFYKGHFSFDNSYLQREGLEWITVDDSLFVIFTFKGKTYIEQFWEMSWNHPYAIFKNGILIGLNWWTPLFVLDINKFNFFATNDIFGLTSTNDSTGQVSYLKIETMSSHKKLQ